MPVAEFAISDPQLVADGTFDREALRAYLARAEELGFTGAWVTEQVVGSAPNLDSNVLLALCAAYTDRIRLGCAVYVSTLASPLHLAKTIATLDQVSGGRLDVGLGAGGGFRAFGAYGMDREAFIRLAGGRCEAEPGTVAVDGDEDLGQRILEAMATTP